MSTGLLALLDDVAAIAKVAAATIDDVAGQAARASVKSAGVVIDDAAVTPRYVVGFAADRELPIVAKIARGSLRNKLVILLPAALLLSFLLPVAITPLLMLGGLYLCYEGAEKIYEAIFPHDAHDHEAKVGLLPQDPATLEKTRVEGAIRTDFILSAEIMAIALATVPDSGLLTQAIVLTVVAIGITAGVYGVVALIVKADDAGIALAAVPMQPPLGTGVRALGRGIVAFMPAFLKLLASVGTLAMLWVGGGIVVHGLEGFGFGWLSHAIHDVAAAAAAASPVAPGFVGWFVGATGSGLFGLLLGILTIPLIGKVFVPLIGAVRSRFR